MKQLVVCLLLTASMCFHVSLAATQCEVDNEKTCTATCNGTKYDVSRLFEKESPLTVTIVNKQYKFEFSCSGKPCGANNISSAVCQTELDSSARAWSCGAADSVVWTIESDSPLKLKVVYNNGDNQNKGIRKSIIELTVNTSHSTDEFSFIKEDRSAAYHFNVLVNSVSSIEASTGSSSGATEGYIGWILISLSLVAFITYFIVGGIVMYTVKGARGVEVIPNVNFWKILPFLVKDGFLLTISPCMICCKKGDSYENI